MKAVCCGLVLSVLVADACGGKAEGPTPAGHAGGNGSSIGGAGGLSPVPAGASGKGSSPSSGGSTNPCAAQAGAAGAANYRDGESFLTADGCSLCTCSSLSLTCVPQPCCPYAGQHYPNESTFAALDGCNSCRCDDGTVSCSSLPCGCDPDAEYNRDYLSRESSLCDGIEFNCREFTGIFYNACGCGCEQSQACPASFECVESLGAAGMMGGAGTAGNAGWPAAAGSTGGATDPSCVTSARARVCPLTRILR